MSEITYKGRTLILSTRTARVPAIEEGIPLDPKKHLKDNISDIIQATLTPQENTKAKRLAHLNNFVRIYARNPENFLSACQLSLRQILLWVRCVLMDEEREIRAAGLRVIRYIIRRPADIQLLIQLKLDMLMARSIDIAIDNQIERLQYLRLMAHFCDSIPNCIPISLIRPLIAVATDGADERDKLTKASVGLLCELTVKCPELMLSCGSLAWLSRAILSSKQLQMTETLVGVIAHLCDSPTLRLKTNVSCVLQEIAAPLSDPSFRLHSLIDEGKTDAFSSMIKETDIDYLLSCRMAFTAVLRSFSLLLMSVRAMKSQGCSVLTAVVQTFYSNNIKQQEAVVHLMFETFCIPTISDCFTSWESLVQFASRITDNSAFTLAQGYLCQEVKSHVPPKVHQRLDIIEQYLALCLLGLVDAGLIQGLVHTVMSTTDESLQLKSIYLIVYLTVKSANWLPLCWSQNSFSSSLIRVANQPDHSPWERHQALNVVYKIQQLLKLLSHQKLEPSLDLQFLLARANRSSMDFHKLPEPPLHWHDLVKKSKVLSSNLNYNQWDWDFIHSTLLCLKNDPRLLTDSMILKFLQQLMIYCRSICKGSLAQSESQSSSDVCLMVGVLLVESLCNLSTQPHVDPTMMANIKDFFLEHCRYICREKSQSDVASGKDASCGTVRVYFLLIAVFLEKSGNELATEKSSVCQSLFDVINPKTEENFVKLLLSVLDCRSSQIQQAIFTKMLVATKEKCRRYATEYLGVVYRLFSGENHFNRWLLKAILGQLEDKSSSVVQSAVSVLEECLMDEDLCDLFVSIVAEEYSSVSLLSSIGDVGVLLLTHVFSIESALGEDRLSAVLRTQLELWEKEFSFKYVRIVDEILHEGLSEYKKTGNGSFLRRTNEIKKLSHTGFPSHLYGQLAKHMKGSAILAKQDIIANSTEVLKSGTLKNSEEIIKMHAALLNLGQIGSQQWGFVRLPTYVVPSIVKIAEESPLLSVRRSAFHAISLIAQCTSGALALGDLGWETSQLGSAVRLASHLGTVNLQPCEKGPIDDNYGKEDPIGGDMKAKGDLIVSQCSCESSTQSPNVSEFGMSMSTGGIESGIKPVRQRHLSKSSDQITELCVYPGSALSVSSCSSCALCRQMDLNESIYGSDCTDGTTASPFRPKQLNRRRPVGLQASVFNNRFSRIDCPIEVACVKDWPQAQPYHNVKFVKTDEESQLAYIDSTTRKISSTPGVTVETPGSLTSSTGEGFADGFIDDYGSSQSLSPQVGLLTDQRQHAEEMKLFRHLMARRRASLSPSHLRHQTFFTGKQIHRHVSVESDYQEALKWRRSYNSDMMSTRWPHTLIEESQQEFSPTDFIPQNSSHTSWLNRGAEYRGDPTLCGITSLQKLTSHRSARLRKLIALRHEPALPIVTSLPAGYGIPEHPVTILEHLGDDGHVGYSRWRKLLRDSYKAGNSLLVESPLEEDSRQSVSATEKDENGNGVAISPELNDQISRARRGSIFASSVPNINRILNTSMTACDDSLDSSRGDPSFWYELISVEQMNRSVTCLPVDINMLTAVDEVFEQSRLDGNSSSSLLGSSSVTQRQEIFGLASEHEPHTCLSCQANVEDIMESDTLRANLILTATDAADLTFDTEKAENSKGESRVVEESNIGRSLIRKEILRLVTVLSARKKHAETGLLRLKQEYPSCFKDLCIYSDVAYLLSLYNFRLSSRSFLQELFQDCDFSKLFESASSLLLTLNTSVSSPTPTGD